MAVGPVTPCRRTRARRRVTRRGTAAAAAIAVDTAPLLIFFFKARRFSQIVRAAAADVVATLPRGCTRDGRKGVRAQISAGRFDKIAAAHPLATVGV